MSAPHALRHGLEITGEVFRDALLSIFSGPEHHDSWEDALKHWDEEPHPLLHPDQAPREQAPREQ